MTPRDILAFLRGLAGGIVGGAAGYALFQWLLRYGLFGPVIPGALLGLGWGLASRRRSYIDGIIAALLALALGLIAMWQTVLLGDDKSFGHFLANLTTRLSMPTMVMLGIGTAMAFWFGMGRNRSSAPLVP